MDSTERYVQKTDGVDLIVENPLSQISVEFTVQQGNVAVIPIVVSHGVEPLTSVLCPTFVVPCCTCRTAMIKFCIHVCSTHQVLNM